MHAFVFKEFKNVEVKVQIYLKIKFLKEHTVSLFNIIYLQDRVRIGLVNDIIDFLE